MTTARPIPSMIRRILPTLGSSVDGEALAAARALGRVLDRAGLGFTDLAAAIPTGEGQGKVTPLARRHRDTRGPIPPFDAYAWRRAYTPRQEARHRMQVAYCQEQRWRLSPRERSFIDNVARLHGNLSIRQGDWLAALADRLEWEGRHAC